MIPRNEEHLINRHYFVDGLTTKKLKIVTSIAIAWIKAQSTFVGNYRLCDITQTILTVAEVIIEFCALPYLQQFGIALCSLLIIALCISSCGSFTAIALLRLCGVYRSIYKATKTQNHKQQDYSHRITTVSLHHLVTQDTINLRNSYHCTIVCLSHIALGTTWGITFVLTLIKSRDELFYYLCIDIVCSKLITYIFA
ncbi:unknown [Leyella stercorea CAG:629]|uniref:Uncharacterized protein n=1 Tax=Leyella stercorea CAG:629 TaxID=1263103 RepID=R7GW81_9BACT|nr:unknown [Leyella stercorea CAG:629]